MNTSGLRRPSTEPQCPPWGTTHHRWRSWPAFRRHTGDDEAAARRGLVARVIGRVTEERKLIICQGEDQAVLFDLEKECVTGIH